MQLEMNDNLHPDGAGLTFDEGGEHVATAAHGDPTIRYWSVA
jgi:hypothetical protein